MTNPLSVRISSDCRGSTLTIGAIVLAGCVLGTPASPTIVEERHGRWEP